MKAQLEAAKEEKRRQEALAERRAQHIEATMRFQKGMKHFKANKGKIIFILPIMMNVTTVRSHITHDKLRTERSSA